MNEDARAAVAPELRAGLDRFPDFALTDEILALFRSADRPPLFAQSLSDAQAAVSCTEMRVPGPDGAPDVRVLVYRPAGDADGPRPAYLHIHGGGFVLGMPEINDASNRGFAAALGCVVVSVDYRLAPETRFPGARDDCHAVLRWMHGQAAALGINPARIAIGGESAGGGHAVALAIHARNEGRWPIRFMLLDAPMLDDRTGSGSDPHPHCGRFVWSPEKNRFGWHSLLGVEPGSDAVSPDSVPARCVDLSGLPPAFISVGAIDLFLEEDLEFARRLARAGVAIDLHVVAGAYHGFGMAGPDAPQVARLEALRLEALGRALHG